MQPIYLDYNATTPIDPAVAEAMQPYILSHYGNPSSTHAYGRATKEAVESARARVAALLECTAPEVVFTSGGSESNNTVLKGVAYTYRHRGNHIITSAIEHPATLNPCRFLEQQGLQVTYLPVDRTGMVDPDDVRKAIMSQTLLISIMHANNEVGTLQPVAEVADRVHAHRGILLHVDAVQAAPWTALDTSSLGADLVSLAAHKVEGPKGVGALWIRRGTNILPQQHGGGQERHRRAGTENVAGAVGMARAFELRVAEREALVPRVREQRDRLADAVAGSGLAEVTGHPVERLPHIASFVARGLEGGSVALALDLEGIAISTGSACATGSAEVSHVLTAMGYPADEARGQLRISLGRTTTDADIDRACRAVPEVLARVAEGSPIAQVAGAPGPASS